MYPIRVTPATTVPEIFLKFRSDIAKVDVLQLRNIKSTAIGNQGEILPDRRIVKWRAFQVRVLEILTNVFDSCNPGLVSD
jgi:hypothetical protein